QKFRKLLATFIVLASVPAFAVYAYAQTGNILAPFQSEATGPKCTILCFFNNPVYQVANGVLPYTINFVTMILAVIFVAIPLIRGLIVVYSVLMCLATILWVNWYPML